MAEGSENAQEPKLLFLMQMQSILTVAAWALRKGISFSFQDFARKGFALRLFTLYPLSKHRSQPGRRLWQGLNAQKVTKFYFEQLKGPCGVMFQR